MDITPDQLRKTRKGLGLTARMAAASVRVTERTWQGYETPVAHKSFRAMPSGLLELFCIKHGLPYPPIRLDGTPTVGEARIIAVLSGTGGSGKTSITIELARALAKAGKRAVVVTDSPGLRQERFAFENPRLIAEESVTLTDYEAKDIRVKLRTEGVIDEHGTAKIDGVDLFIYQGYLDRLAKKEAPLATIQLLKTETDFIFLDISHDAETALLVSDAVVFVFDLNNHFAFNSAKNMFSTGLARNTDSGASPKLFCLLTNKEASCHQSEIGIYHQVQNFGPPVLATTLSNAHIRERRKVQKSRALSGRYELLTDAAPYSMSSMEYRSLANELLRHLGQRFQV